MFINVTLKAGTYYIGCPSAVTDNKVFKRGQTAIPVGNFLGSDGTQFRVESGSIGIIPYENLSVYKEDASEIGMVRHFKSPVQFIYRDGQFTILSGKYYLDINTHKVNHDDTFTFEEYYENYEDEDEEDEEDEDEDDEDEEDEDEDEARHGDDEDDEDEEDEEDEDEACHGDDEDEKN